MQNNWENWKKWILKVGFLQKAQAKQTVSVHSQSLSPSVSPPTLLPPLLTGYPEMALDDFFLY